MSYTVENPRAVVEVAVADYLMEHMPQREFMDSYSDIEDYKLPYAILLRRARRNLLKDIKSWPLWKLESEWSKITGCAMTLRAPESSSEQL